MTDAHELLAAMLHRIAPEVDLDDLDRTELIQDAAYFNPSFFPAESNRIDSRMRLSRVSGRLAV